MTCMFCIQHVASVEVCTASGAYCKITKVYKNSKILQTGSDVNDEL